MTTDHALELAETFGAVARALVAEHGTPATLERVVLLAVETIDSCEHAGMSVVQGRSITTGASSDDVPSVVDRIQSETGEGPCLDAIREHRIYRTGRLSEEDRWPSFSARAHAESGIESIVAFRLFVGDGTMGALNLYSTSVDAFDDHDVAVGTVFATHAAVAWSYARKVGHLEVGMETRQLIGAATGILMARQHLSETEAFAVLTRASQRLNIKLRTVAERIVRPEDEGTGPTAAEPEVPA